MSEALMAPHETKFRVKWKQLPAMTAESEAVGAAVVPTK